MKRKITLSIITSLVISQSICANDISKLDTITVTAQKTEEKLKDVPISISVFGEYTLEDRDIDTLSDLAKFTPGLEIVSYGSSDKFAPSIRGMYSDYSTRSSVAGLYIDGIPVTGGTGFDEILMDIERIEVLKGPQGTLYGKNTEVGAINIITKKPNNETQGKVKGTLGSDSKQELIFNASGPIIEDKFYISLAGKHFEKDGFVKNTNTGKMIDNRKHDYGKINLRYTPNDNLDVSLIASKAKYKDGGNSSGLTKTGIKEVSSDLEGYNNPSIFQSSLNLNYTINDKLKISSITAYRKQDDKNANDFDYTSDMSKQFHMFTDSNYKTLSEELKLNYENKGIKLVSGLFLEKEDTHIDKLRDAWFGTNKAVEDISSDSIGVFSHIIYPFNKKLSLLGGLRYDKIKQKYKSSTQNIENDINEVSPKIGLSYDIHKNMMLYTTVAKGYRTGGFNTFVPVGYSKTFDQETLYSYEIGLKGLALENKLEYDTTVYYMDIDDMQVDYYIDASNRTKLNAAKASSLGIEISLNFQASDNLNIFAGFSYNNTEFDEYKDARGDYSGNKTIFSPDYNFHLGSTYRNSKGYYASADISGYGDMYLDITNDYKRDAYELVNVKVGYEQELYDIFLYAKNIFDKGYDINGHFNGSYSYYSEPREIGVQLAYRF